MEDQKNVLAYVTSQTEECQTQELHQCIQAKPMQVKRLFCRNDIAPVHQRVGPSWSAEHLRSCHG